MIPRMERPTLLRRDSSGAKLREVYVWKGIFPKSDTVELIRLIFFCCFNHVSFPLVGGVDVYIYIYLYTTVEVSSC